MYLNTDSFLLFRLRMDALEITLKQQCAQAPRWLQIEIQAFWYGLISWTITCAEDKTQPSPEQITIQELLVHADKEFEFWPTLYFETSIKDFLILDLNLEQLNNLFEKLVHIFQDIIPTDINIFTLLSNGDTIAPEQWERLYDAIAFTHPIKQEQGKKTKRIHGRRGITPIRRKKIFTRHKLSIKKEL